MWSWIALSADREPADYYAEADYSRYLNELGDGPYRGGPSFAGNPVAFEIRRVNR